MQANDLFEIPLVRWLRERIQDEGSLLMHEAIYGGALYVQCSPNTARRYINKHASQRGSLVIFKDGNRKNRLGLRDETDHQGQG